jgi:uncharacterized lipoprotein YmbA
MMRGRRVQWASLFVIAILISGCAGNKVQTREFVLSSLKSRDLVGQSGSVTQNQARPPRGPAVAVGPISMPPYLRRPQIVRREGGNRVVASTENQWGEDLDAGFAQVLAQNLTVLIPSDRVSRFPWSLPTPMDYRVSVQIERFERIESGDVFLRATWTLSGAGSDQRLSMGQFADRQPSSDESIEATVEAMSRSIENLSRIIATAVQAWTAPS